MEDGCSKRFDLAVAFNPQHPTSGPANEGGKLTPNEGRAQQLHKQHSSNTIPYQQSASELNSGVHAEYLGSGNGQDAVWS